MLHTFTPQSICAGCSIPPKIPFPMEIPSSHSLLAKMSHPWRSLPWPCYLKLSPDPHSTQSVVGLFACLFVSAVLGFELRVSHLLGRYCTTWVMLPALFCFSYFSDRVLHFCPWPSLRPRFYYLCVRYSWDYKCELLYLAQSFASFTIYTLVQSLSSWFSASEKAEALTE
jgi:hypothetical protein